MELVDSFLLKTFLLLAETQSFTQTAKRVGRSQSAVSMQIVKLEELLQCQLFTRTKRKVMLTNHGEKLVGYAHQIVSLSEDLLRRFNEPELKGEIRFGSPEDFATFFLPEILSRFSKNFPQVSLHVNCDLTMNLIKAFEKKQYDLVLIKDDPKHLHPGARQLWQEKLVWVGRQDNNQNTTFKQICKEHKPLPLVLSPAPCVYRARVIEALDKKGIAWDVAYVSPSFSGIIAAVKAGLGYAALPQMMLPSGLEYFETKNGWPKLTPVAICLLSRQSNNLVLQAFSNYIELALSSNKKN